MLFSTLAVGASASSYLVSGGTADKNYAFGLETDGATNTTTALLVINATALGEILENRDLTRADLESFLPQIVLDAMDNKTLPNVEDVLDAMKDTGILSYSAITEIFSEDLIKSYVDLDLVDRMIGLDNLDQIMDMDALVNEEIETIMANEALANAFADDIQPLLTADIIEAAISLDDVADLLDDSALDTLLTADVENAIAADATIKNHLQELAEGTLSLEQLFDAADYADLIKAIGIKTVLNKVGVGAFIDLVGKDALVETIGSAELVKIADSDVLVDEIGKETLINALGGYSEIMDTIEAVDNTYYDTLIDKAFEVIDESKLFDIADQSVLADTLKEIAKDIALGIDEIALNGRDVYYNGFTKELDAKAAIAAVAEAVPTLNDFATVQTGDNISTLSAVITLNSGVVLTFNFEVYLTGDTSVINRYADKLNDYVVKYTDVSRDGTTLVASFDDGFAGAPLTLAEVMNRVLNSTRISDARKADIFSVFTLTGDELVAKLESFDFDVINDVVDGKGEYVRYIAKVRDLTVKALNKLEEIVPDVYLTTSLADMYDETSSTVRIVKTVSVDAAEVLDKLLDTVKDMTGKLEGLNPDLSVVAGQTITAGVDLTVKLNNIYRVRFYDSVETKNLVYTTFLTEGALIDTIDGVAQLAGYTTWYDADGNEVTEIGNANIDLYADYEEEDPIIPDPPITPDNSPYYTVTFVADEAVIAIVKYAPGQKELTYVPKVPEKVGFFGKWEDYTLNNKNITVKAIYTPANKLTATFVADGKVVATVTFYEGDTKLSSTPKVPAKTGYSAKWESYTLGKTDITINAIYTAKTYKVRFFGNGGTGSMDAQTMTYDQAANLTKNAFVREGYTFVGWNTVKNGSGTAYTDGQSVKNLSTGNEVVLHAQWKVNEIVTPEVKTYTATFKADGKVVATVEFKEGDTALANVPEVPAKTGYAGKWADYKLTNANITIEALYTANTYTIVFNANGGAGTMANQTMTYDMAVALTANTLTREGYEFKGWNTKADGTGTAYADGASVKNLAESGEVTLYAQWEEANEPVVEPPVEPKNNTTLIVVIIVIVVLATAGVVVGGVIFGKKR
ncbi:MAG: InlB B-repeat-containing protein [Clostridia bacterium]|nr:InlB B-repeat-containing protein [Clostridia bacterium]